MKIFCPQAAVHALRVRGAERPREWGAGLVQQGLRHLNLWDCHSIQCKVWHLEFLILTSKLQVWAGFVFFIHIRGEESNVAASYWNYSCITSSGGWALKCVGFLYTWITSGTLWVPVINSCSFKSRCLTDTKLCFMLSVDFQDFGWAQREDGIHFQGTDLALDSAFKETWGCLDSEYFFKPKLFSLAWTKTQNHLQFAQTVCKTTEGKKLSWILSSQFSALKHLLVFPFNRDA